MVLDDVGLKDRVKSPYSIVKWSWDPQNNVESKIQCISG
jgi:hypothetical protein